MPEIFVTDYGTAKIVAERMYSSAARVDTLKLVMDKILLDLLAVTRTQIDSGGRRGGGGYAHLKQDTVRKKGNAQILRTSGSRPKYDRIDSDALVRSVTVKGAPFQIWITANEGFEFGTDRPWAFVHQYGSPARRIPARPFLRVLPGDADRWTRWITQWLIEPFEKPVEEAGAGEI